MSEAVAKKGRRAKRNKTKKKAEELRELKNKAGEVNEPKNKASSDTADNDKELSNTEVTKKKELPADRRLRKPRSEKKLLKRGKVEHTFAEALEYLQQWKTDRSSWKFRKSIQVLLISKCCTSYLIPDVEFSTFLEYAGSIKESSGARDWLKELCVKTKEENKEDKTAIEYKRAKKILKSFKKSKTGDVEES